MTSQTKVVVFGSSHVKRLGKAIGDLQLPSTIVTYMGHSGLCTSGRRFEKAKSRLLGAAPDYVFIIIGGNDLTPKCNVKGVFKNLLKLRKDCLNVGAKKVVISAILPRPCPRDLSAHKFEVMRRGLNRRLSRKLKPAREFIGIGTALSPKRYFHCDGVHLNKKGNVRFSRMIRRHLRRIMR